MQRLELINYLQKYIYLQISFPILLFFNLIDSPSRVSIEDLPTRLPELPFPAKIRQKNSVTQPLPGVLFKHFLGWGGPMDIESLQNRLLKVSYVPATSASFPMVSFFFSFLFFVAAATDSTNEANKVPLSSLYS